MSLPVLELEQFIVDLLSVDVGPYQIEITVDRLQDAVVKTVQFLEQIEFPLDLLQSRILGHFQTEQFFAFGVGGELAEQCVKVALDLSKDKRRRKSRVE